MKVCFVLNDIALSGGIGVVVEHAHQLADRHGFDVTVATTKPELEPWTHRRLADITCVTVDEAQHEHYDVAVATLWSTCYRLFDIPAERYAYFVQSMEDRFFEPDAPAERVLAAITHALPVSFITEARWIADTLAEIRPDAPCFLVRNGVAKDVFALAEPPPARPSRPLHILLEGHPEVWFKGLPEAAAVLRELHEPHVTTFVSPSGKDGDPSVGADRVIGPLSQAELAAEYADTDVVLKLSRVEGMYGPPLEGFHMGATCVTTPVTGHEEFIQHGFNALVTDWDDPRGTARTPRPAGARPAAAALPAHERLAHREGLAGVGAVRRVHGGRAGDDRGVGPAVALSRRLAHAARVVAGRLRAAPRPRARGAGHARAHTGRAPAARDRDSGSRRCGRGRQADRSLHAQPPRPGGGPAGPGAAPARTPARAGLTALPSPIP